MSEFKYMEELDDKIENIKYKEKINDIEICLNQALQVLGYYKDSAIKEKIKFINDELTTLINHIKKLKGIKKQYNGKKAYKIIVERYNKKIINKLKETINKEPEGLNKDKLNRLDELLPELEEEPEEPKPEPEEPKPEPEPEPEEPEQPKIKKEINYKIDELLNNYSQLSENPKYKDALERYDILKWSLRDVIKEFKKLKENIKGDDPETVYKKYKNVVFMYNTNVKHNLKTYISMTKNESDRIILNGIKSLLPDLEIKKPEPEQQPKPEPEQQQKPEQPIKGINSTWTQPPLNERITRPNPDAPPVTEVSKTPIDDFTEPKPEPEPETEQEPKQPEPEEEEEEETEQVHNDNSQIIERSPKEDFIIANRYIDELKNNPELDIIAGVGEVIEFIATSNLDDETTNKLIDKMLDMKDSHGNLLFNNRFQIEDLIRNRKKRRRLKYLLPKRIIKAEKPDEQKLIINPMLRRGRIASMTSAKERYYNYI